MELRDRHAGDLEDLVALAARVHEADAYPMYLPEGDLTRFLTRPEPFAAWVAVQGEQLLGHVALHSETSPPVMELISELSGERPPLYIARLMVDVDARRAGAGRRLLDRARREAVAAGCIPYLDVVEQHSESAAIALYRDEGWEEIGRVRFAFADGALDEVVFRGPSTRAPRPGT